MTGDIAYVQISSGSSRATLGLYAGMRPSELQLLVRASLQPLAGACAGFLVAPKTTNRRKKVVPRIVPLSVAAQAPELLAGRVSALITPLEASQAAPEPLQQVSEVSSRDNKIPKLVNALQQENQLSTFEKELLLELCEQRQQQVTSVLSSDRSAEQKKQFLLGLIRPEEKLKQDKQETLLSRKVAAIGRKVFSPHVQTQILALAAESRERWDDDAEQVANLMELLTVVEKLLDKHALPEEHGAHLLELVLDENRVLLSALQNYKKDRNMSDLETTAKRLAALACDPPKPISTRKTKKSPRELAKQANGKGRGAAASTPSAVSVIRSLHAQHMLTSLELDIVQALVAQEDSQVLQILKDFELSDHRNVGTLRDALVSIVEEITMELGDEEKAAAAFARGMGDAVRDEEDEVEWGDGEDVSSYLEWQRHTRYLIGQWETQNLLVPIDAITLRRLVASRHNLLESAYEVYAGDGDGSELLDTLQRVAKLQRQIEQSRDGAGSGDQSLRLEDVVREMQRRGSLKPSDAAGLLLLFQGGNEALQAANEAFQADGDVHELEETLHLVVKHAKFGDEADQPEDEGQAVALLLSELAKSGRLEKWQLQLLLSLSNSHDARVLAAVDVYNEDHNLAELVDTLDILVELAAWERHRRAMVHDWIAPLARSGKLPRGGAERLVQLVKARDDRVVAALVVFLSDGNKEEFVDTLARIACLEALKLKGVTSPTSSQPEKRRDEAEEGHLVLALLEELEESGVLSSEERGQVEALVSSGDPKMLAALDVLASTNDAADFADTTRRILAIPDESEERPKAATPASPLANADVAASAQQAAAAEVSTPTKEKSDEVSSAHAEEQLKESLPLTPTEGDGETKQQDEDAQKDEEEVQDQDEEGGPSDDQSPAEKEDREQAEETNEADEEKVEDTEQSAQENEQK